MRVFLLLLILANLVFFAWSQGYLGGTDAAGREPERLGAQINPSKLRIVSTIKPAPPVESCRIVGNLSLADAQRLQTSLGQQLSDATITLSGPDESRAWDVTITDLGNRAAAETKLAELKKLGIDDARVIAANNSAFAILLATFQNESTAREQLQALAKKGVKSAKIAVRQSPDGARLMLRGPDAALARLPELTKDAANVTLSDCPAT